MQEYEFTLVVGDTPTGAKRKRTKRRRRKNAKGKWRRRLKKARKYAREAGEAGKKRTRAVGDAIDDLMGW